MQEGTLFFLFSWLAVWSIIFMGNSPAQKRSGQLAVLLTIMMCAGTYINIVQIQINLIWLPVFIWSFFQWRTIQKGNVFLVSVSVFGVMIAFSCFRILTMLYPVWLFVDWKILCSLLVVASATFFQREWKLRLSIVLIGSLFGQMIFAFLLNYNGMPIRYLFSSELLDLLSLIVLFNGIFHVLEHWMEKRAARKSYMAQTWKNREMRQGNR